LSARLVAVARIGYDVVGHWGSAFEMEASMKLRSRIFCSLAFAAVACSAEAQQASAAACESPDQAKKESIAVLRDLQGSVLVSDKDGVASATSGQRVLNKSRITATSKASVIVAFDCGCNVLLKENERIDVELPRSCSTLVAAVQPVPVGVALGATAGAPASATATTTAGLLAAGAIGVGGYALHRRDRNVSPN
jgi:hypothetical protein